HGISGLLLNQYQRLLAKSNNGVSYGLASSATSVRPSAPKVRDQRSAVFSLEQARQRALYPRTEKIEVTLQIPGLQGTLLVMNKGVSTPHSCARRE
uniref:Uncharacterized protein n=1 Tax=Hucho hucho TaxID=62062 RepID=A0A4W5N0P6_9TELE